MQCHDQSPSISTDNIDLKAVCLGLPLVCLLLGSGLTQAFADTATVYRCTKPDGTVVFSDKPCGPNAKESTIDAPSAGTGSKENLKGEEELAKQYDEEQRAAQEAAARARAQQQTAPVPRQPSEPQTIYVPSYVPYIAPSYSYPYPYRPRPRPPEPRPQPSSPPPLLVPRN